MSIENNIKKIADLLEQMNGKMDSYIAAQIADGVSATSQTLAPTAPVQQTTPPVLPQPPMQAPVAPPTPTPEPVVQAPAGPQCPFNDANGMIQYVMQVYNELGPQKGAEIQTAVLGPMGINNVNDTKPEQYGELWTKIEALRGK